MKGKTFHDVQALWCSFRHHVDVCYAARLSASGIADAVGCSERTLFRLTHQQAGKTPMGLVREVRIQAAERLLEQGLKVEAIALLVGYRSRSSFYRAYRAERGAMPSRH